MASNVLSPSIYESEDGRDPIREQRFFWIMFTVFDRHYNFAITEFISLRFGRKYMKCSRSDDSLKQYAININCVDKATKSVANLSATRTAYNHAYHL